MNAELEALWARLEELAHHIRLVAETAAKVDSKKDDRLTTVERNLESLASDLNPSGISRLAAVERDIAYLRKAKVNRTDGTHVYKTTVSGTNLGEDFIPEGQMPKPMTLHSKDKCPEGCKDSMHIEISVDTTLPLCRHGFHGGCHRDRSSKPTQPPAARREITPSILARAMNLNVLPLYKVSLSQEGLERLADRINEFFNGGK